MIGPRPRQLLLNCEAAAAAPALLGSAAAASVVLAGKGLAAVLAVRLRHRQSERGRGVGKQRDAGNEPAKAASPILPRGPGHQDTDQACGDSRRAWLL